FYLTSKANHDITGNVRMASDAGQDALKNGLRFTRIHRTPGFVGEGDHTVDIRKIAFEFFGAKSVSYIMRNRSGAIDTGDYGNVIACPNASIRSHEALEIAHAFWRIVSDRLCVGAKLIIAAKLLHRDVMRVNMRSGCDPA